MLNDEILSFEQILELPSHPFYVGVQFHPEFKSRPDKPSALFLGTRWSLISRSSDSCASC